jgi:hypothetical protein
LDGVKEKEKLYYHKFFISAGRQLLIGLSKQEKTICVRHVVGAYRVLMGKPEKKSTLKA